MRWLLAIVAGAAVCTVLDHQHVVWGVLSYTDPVVWDQAWWVPLLFGSGTLVALLLVDPMRRLLGGAPQDPAPAVLVLADMAGFAAAYYLTAVAQHAPELVTIVLVAAWVIRVAAGMPGWAVAYCIGSALVGPAVEATISGFGLFHYQHPELIGVARWLPALYLHVGVVAVSIGSVVRAPAPEMEAIEIEVAV